MAAAYRKTRALLRTLRTRPHRVVVAGDSMLPAFEPGDRLLIVPVAGAVAGQVVAVRDPRQPDRILVKRVRAVTPEGVDVRGDNPSASTDSRHFGPVESTAIVGRIVYRYHPPTRAGRAGG